MLFISMFGSKDRGDYVENVIQKNSTLYCDFVILCFDILFSNEFCCTPFGIFPLLFLLIIRIHFGCSQASHFIGHEDEYIPAKTFGRYPP